LVRYYGGLRTVAANANATPEFPHGDEHPQIEVEPELYPDGSGSNSLPMPHIDNPYPNYASSAYESRFSKVEACYLDEEEAIAVPRIRAYEGTIQGFPEPIMGSYHTIGINGNKCYDRHGRFGPYGYGYPTSQGGIGAGVDGEREGVDQIWPARNRIDYSKIHWGDAQRRCFEKNQHRFPALPKTADEKWRTFGRTGPNDKTSVSSNGRLARTAIVLRIWNDYEWTQETILHLRAMIAELSLLSGGEYQVFFLIQVKDSTIPIWSSDEIYSKVLSDALPEEFRGMGALWSEKQMELAYYGLKEWSVMNRGIYGVYRSAHFPLQYFAHTHPEFEYFWNWEVDIRFTGHWYELLESLRSFAREQPRKGLWERNERFYVPSVHGTWEEFRERVRNATETLPLETEDQLAAFEVEPPVWGRKAPKEAPIFPDDPKPPRSYENDQYQWGVGEEADLITLNPLFNPLESGWVFVNDITGYKLKKTDPPRRTSIITASRLSKRLLTAMHKETSQFRHTMFDEMWPATVALHHGLKAVYAPHPVFVDRAWPPSKLDKTFNGGPNGESGSAKTSPFNIWNEHNFRGATWYFNAAFSGNLWRRWWGFNVEVNEGDVAKKIKGEGRMCLPPMLLHPIKGFELAAKESNGRSGTGDG
jgi:Protein of unknown function (DUF3405)